jgi:acyl-CoA synthetase (AMP-forming)/AMP-acid ligase II
MPCNPDLAAYYREKGYWTDRLLTDYLEAAVERFPDRIAVRDERFGCITYLELHALSLRLASALQTGGVRKGDRFVVALPNWHQVSAFVLALNYLGAIGVHLPITSGSHEFEGVLTTSGAVGIVVPYQFNQREFVALIDPLARAMDAVALMVSVGEDHSTPGWLTFDQLLASAGNDVPVQEPSFTADDIATLLFTSGSSGVPKGVMHSSNSIGAMNAVVVPSFDLGPDDVILMAAPLGFSGGFVHGLRLAVFLGATLVLQEAWNAGRYLDLLHSEQATFSMITPTLLRDFLELPRLEELADSLSLSTIMCGGSFVSSNLLHQAREKLPGAMTTVLWGMTEGIGTACRPDTPVERLTGTHGQPFPGTELKTIDNNGNRTNTGQEGELVMRTPSQFLGYFNLPEIDEITFLSGGWLRTGDLAIIEADGYIRITGRKKDIIIRGSANISPLEIEEILIGDPKVHDIACVGIPDERLGERVCACVVLEPGVADAPALTLDDLVKTARISGLAKNKWPQRMVLMDTLPLTSSGKLRRQALQALVIEQLGLGPAQS